MTNIIPSTTCPECTLMNVKCRSQAHMCMSCDHKEQCNTMSCELFKYYECGGVDPVCRREAAHTGTFILSQCVRMLSYT